MLQSKASDAQANAQILYDQARTAKEGGAEWRKTQERRHRSSNIQWGLNSENDKNYQRSSGMYGPANNTGALTSKANESSRGSLNFSSSNNLEPAITTLNRGGKKIDLGNPNKCSTVGAHMLNMNSHDP